MGEQIRLYIFNLNGKSLLESNLINGENKVPVEGLNGGVYFIHIQAEGEIITRKLIVN